MFLFKALYCIECMLTFMLSHHTCCNIVSHLDVTTKNSRHIWNLVCSPPSFVPFLPPADFREGAKLVGNRDVISERIAKRGCRRSSPHPSICWGAELINQAQSRHWQGPSSRTTVSRWWLINHHLKARSEDAATMCSAAHGLTLSASFRTRMPYAISYIHGQKKQG